MIITQAKNQNKFNFLTPIKPYSTEIILLVLTLPLLFSTNGEYSLMAHDESLYANRARAMVDSGDWLNPWKDAHYKTPGLYWIIGIIYTIFGRHELSARIPSMIACLGMVILLYHFVKHITSNPKIAFLSAIIVNLQFLWFHYSRLANPDTLNITLCFTGIFLLIKSETENHPKKSLFLALAGFCLGLGFIIRGFMLFFILIALFPYLIFEHKRHHHLKQINLYLGFIVGLIPLISWLKAMFDRYGFESFRRLYEMAFLVGTDNRGNHGIFYYVWNVLALSFPWGILALFTIIKSIKNPIPKYQSLLLGFPLVFFIEISASATRLSHYALFLYPFLAIWASLTITGESFTKFYKKIGYFGLFLFGITLIGSVYLVLKKQPNNLAYIALGFTLSLTWSYLLLVRNNRLFSSVNQSLGLFLGGIYLVFNLMGFMGLIGNYNPQIKKTLKQPPFVEILANNRINMIDSRGKKLGILLAVYTPSLKQGNLSLNSIPRSQYIWISDEQLQQEKNHQVYTIVGKIEDWNLLQIQ